jgi:hypothetical protein
MKELDTKFIGFAVPCYVASKFEILFNDLNNWRLKASKKKLKKPEFIEKLLDDKKAWTRDIKDNLLVELDIIEALHWNDLPEPLWNKEQKRIYDNIRKIITDL